MIVTMESAGGVAGVRLASSLETDDLPADLVGPALRALDAVAAAPPGRDHRPRYRLTVHQPAGPRTVDLVEPHVPAALRPLLDELVRRARDPSGRDR
jgi:hypothetical protein